MGEGDQAGSGSTADAALAGRSHYGDFQGSRRLSDRDVQTIAAWVDGGAKEGNPADLPAAPQFADGWQIGNPDLVLTMKEPYTIPASGTIAWQTLPAQEYAFPQDTWIQAIEVRPGNRKVVHHATVGVVSRAENGSETSAGNLHLYSPGLEAMIWRDGYGKLIRKARASSLVCTTTRSARSRRI
jgi:hypothetical protein